MDQQDAFCILSKLTIIDLSKNKLDDYILSENFISITEIISEKDKFNYCNGGIQSCNFNNQNFTKSNLNHLKLLELSEAFVPQPLFCLHGIENYNFVRKMKIRLDAILCSLILNELQRSKIFRSQMLINLYYQYKKIQKLDSLSICDLCHIRLWAINVVILLQQPKRNIIDYKWNKKIEILANERCELENAMAWLSTLGGAFSALGDTYLDCAEKAGVISLQQLKLALRLGDPITICRCKIYLAMSLLQRGYFSQTKKLIRELYEFSTKGEGTKDFRLRNMCIAVWNRLKYLKSKKNALK